MGFVDDGQDGRRLCQQGEKLRHRQPFRRAEDNDLAAARDARQGGVLVRAREAAVELHGRDAQRMQLFQLVLHQRDQRRYHEGGAGQEGGGQLVAQRLAAAGGHDGQRIPADQHAVDDFLLAVAQAGDAKDGAQQALDGSARLARFAGLADCFAAPFIIAILIKSER
jgi:hypothetical protein